MQTFGLIFFADKFFDHKIFKSKMEDQMPPAKDYDNATLGTDHKDKNVIFPG